MSHALMRATLLISCHRARPARRWLSHPDATLHLVTKILDLAFHQILGAHRSSERPEIANPKSVNPSRTNWSAPARPTCKSLSKEPSGGARLSRKTVLQDCIMVAGRREPIRPGMGVSAEIKTGMEG